MPARPRRRHGEGQHAMVDHRDGAVQRVDRRSQACNRFPGRGLPGPGRSAMIRLRALLVAAMTLVATPALADTPLPPRTANGLALTPPMGWNSWNKFGCDIDETKVRGV